MSKESSPYEISLEESKRVCDRKSCAPFYIREWETMIVGVIIIGIVIFMCCCCKSVDHESVMIDRFKDKTAAASKSHTSVSRPRYHSLSSTQAMMSQDDRVGHNEGYAAGPPTHGTVMTGARRPSRGPSVDRFVDFARADRIDKLKNGEPNPMYSPETSDADLEQVLRAY